MVDKRAEALAAETTKLAMQQRVLESDMKPAEIEGMVVDKKGDRLLGDQEVDDHMTAIHEQD